MSNSPLLLSPMIILFSIISIIMTRTHLLMCLLNLEVMILGLVMMSSSIISASSFDTLILFILLTLGACEASLGLSCLVKMSRSFGNDNLNNMSLFLC